MTSSLPPSESRKGPIAGGVVVAAVTYSASLAAQQFFPPVKQALAISLSGGVEPTYYLRVVASLIVGLVVAAVLPKRPTGDTMLAWTTGAALLACGVVICIFP